MTADGPADRVFELAADLFGLLSAPARLRIVCQLREGEKSVGELIEMVGVSQPAISQHLRMLYRAGIVDRRRAGASVFYRVVSEPVQLLCDAVCSEQAVDRGPAAQRQVE